MSKKRRAKIDKIKNDASLTQEQKETIMSQIEADAVDNKKQKRSQITDFKDSKNFVEQEKIITSENQVADSSLWGVGEKNFLEDVTMNMIPDEEAIKNIKGQTVMKWDSQKKKYQLQKVDRDGRVMSEKRNEAGKKITKKMKEKEGKKKESIYKKWQQRTHLTLQKSGEMEDVKTMD